MKIFKAILLACAILTTVCIAAEEGWHPAEFTEYAPLFTESMAVTPKEAVAAATRFGSYPEAYSGAKIFDPIIVKCPNGMTAGYIVIAYKGDDAEIISSINYLVKEFNKDSIDDINSVLSALSNLAPDKDVHSYMVSAWKWDSPVSAIGLGGAPLFLRYLPDYIKRAQLDTNNVESVRFLYNSPGSKSEFVLYAKTGPKGAYYFGHEDRLTNKGEPELRSLYIEELDEYLNTFNKNKELINDNLKRWEGIDKIDIESHFKDGYYRIEGSNEGHDDDGHTISNVPDLNAPGKSCWVGATACIIAYYSEKLHYVIPGSGVSQSNIPVLGETVGQTLYAIAVKEAFTKYINDNGYNWLILNGATNHDNAILLDRWLESCNYVYDWKFEAWNDGVGSSSRWPGRASMIRCYHIII